MTTEHIISCPFKGCNHNENQLCVCPDRVIVFKSEEGFTLKCKQFKR